MSFDAYAGASSYDIHGPALERRVEQLERKVAELERKLSQALALGKIKR